MDLNTIREKMKNRAYVGKHPSTAEGLDTIIPKNPLKDKNISSADIKEQDDLKSKLEAADSLTKKEVDKAVTLEEVSINNGEGEITSDRKNELLLNAEIGPIVERELKTEPRPISERGPKTEPRPISERGPKTEPRLVSERGLKTEPRPVSERGLKTELASKQNQVKSEIKMRESYIDHFEILNRDEMRFLKYLNTKLQEVNQSKVAVSRSEFERFANINKGRFYSTRQGLLDKKLIAIKETKEVETNRLVVIYEMLE